MDRVDLWFPLIDCGLLFYSDYFTGMNTVCVRGGIKRDKLDPRHK